jgi:hypothetical protein
VSPRIPEMTYRGKPFTGSLGVIVCVIVTVAIIILVYLIGCNGGYKR